MGEAFCFKILTAKKVSNFSMGERPAMTGAASDVRMGQQGIQAVMACVSLTKGKGWEQCLPLRAETIQAERRVI